MRFLVFHFGCVHSERIGKWPDLLLLGRVPVPGEDQLDGRLRGSTRHHVRASHHRTRVIMSAHCIASQKRDVGQMVTPPCQRRKASKLQRQYERIKPKTKARWPWLGLCGTAGPHTTRVHGIAEGGTKADVEWGRCGGSARNEGRNKSERKEGRKKNTQREERGEKEEHAGE
eukprot:699037-Rhodomonas_salina.2